ncbi:MAG TPA: hypothetical protein VFZ61_33030, partial [Polyangiales bacterium]
MPQIEALLKVLELLEPGAGLREARWALATSRRPPPIAGLGGPLAAALRAARAWWAREALRAADEALWAAAERCQGGWAEHVSAERLE